MTSRLEQLRAELLAAWSEPDIEELGSGRFLVTVPTHRFEHDTFPVVVSRADDGGDRPWVVSDEGYTAFLLGDSYEQLVDVLSESPVASADPSGNTLTLRSADDTAANAVLAFATEMGALLVAANTLDAYIAARRAATTAERSTDVMAREVKAQLDRTSPRLAPLVRLRRRLTYAHLDVRAPLAVNRYGGDAGIPAIVASTVDFSITRAARIALGTTSLVLDVAEKLAVDRRFVIVRGEPSRTADLEALYDRENTTVVSTVELEPLLETTLELEHELLGA